ncbi:putative quinol monooxygenase [Saccharopolyspora sp. NFXS83]|uniref:putative quinol monooxygenase n=1 Tax=Saccharopolyspora sp. NFXS83 TaxID=2993560 RepID=UPI00224A4D55|nr:putative quinol monooxygenase [Saccharopolyspora sp. NFXS83]MCX2730605.1 putative quinol monooxygenase [Saccharopolyspora sp. NFXS83]
MENALDCYVVLLEVRAKPGKEAELKAFIAGTVTASRADRGNIDYEPHEVEGQPGTFIVFERWDTREAFEGHLKAPRRQELAPQLMELLDGAADDGVRFLRPFRPGE